MTTLYIIRHGKYLTPNAVIPYRLAGFHLAPEGIEKVEQLSERLKDVPFVAIYTSPLERTAETATILASVHPDLTVITDDRLLEVRNPAQGMTEAEINKINPFDWSLYETAWFRDGHGETLDEVFDRIYAIAQEKIKLHENQSFVLVSHGDLVMVLAAYYMGIPRTVESLIGMPYVPMAGGFKIEIEGDRASVTPLIEPKML